MSILYRYGSTYYINMTNRCPCSCVFCVRDSTPRLGDADSLWLDHEPTVDEVIGELRKVDLSKSREVVFCGYGEPTERFDDVLECARRIKAEFGKPVRLDTNGLGSLINGRDIVPEMEGVIDSVSISLTAGRRSATTPTRPYWSSSGSAGRGSPASPCRWSGGRSPRSPRTSAPAWPWT